MSVNSYIAYILFALGVGFASFSFSFLVQPLLIGGGLLLGGGLICLAFTIFHHVGPITNPALHLARFSANKQLGICLLGQSAFIIITFTLFHLLENQTQLNTRLQALEPGYIVQILQQHPISLGLIPWLLYSILGVGLAYISICLNKKPILSRVMISKTHSKLGYFIQNLLSIATDVVTIGSFVFVISFALVGLSEAISILFDLSSLFLTPFRSIFICGLIILVFRKSNSELIAWMNRFQIGAGKAFVLYIGVFSFFLLWLHSFGGWFSFGQEVTEADQVMKSQLAGSFSEENLKTRLTLLIWGWWSIWIPWMTSLVSRASIGRSFIRALIQSILVPFIFFCVYLPKAGAVNGLLQQFNTMPWMQLLLMSGVLLFVWFAWGHMHTMGDVARGAMLPIGKLSARPLSRWMTVVTLWLACYIPGWFLLGWLPMQIMVTLGGLFIMIVVGFFLLSWGSLLFHREALKKYKVPV